MARRAAHAPLAVYLNARLVGYLRKAPGGAISFQYAPDWLSWEHTLPISLSLPLREDSYAGQTVAAVFENLLPDSDGLRGQVAKRVGAQGSDAYSLLAAIGRDCVGALQFLDESEATDESRSGSIEGEPVEDDDIERMLLGLARAPLGLRREDAFRISLAGAQEKTALLHHQGRWIKPHGTTPTTHIIKTQIGTLPGGIDLSNSVENEFYCLKLAAAFGLPVAKAEMATFGETRTLVVERFDRLWTKTGRLLRLPQEDCCQALSVPPSRKYQADGGPGMTDLLRLFRGSDEPQKDHAIFLKAQLFFWLIGATDGHAKNFSLFLRPGGRFALAPLYDILTAQPSFDANQFDQRQMRLAMSVGDSGHYRMHEIHIRHFQQTAQRANLPRNTVADVVADMAEIAPQALQAMESELNDDALVGVHSSVRPLVEHRISAMLRAIAS